MTAVLWPTNMMPSEVMFHPSQASRSGGRSISGREQVVVSAAGFWRAKLSFTTSLRSLDAHAGNKHMTWRAMLAILEGRSNELMIGPYDKGNTPAEISGVSYADTVPFDDGTTFDDGTEFSQFATPVEVAVAAARGAVSLIATMIGGHTPQPGQYFGTYNRLYLIKRADLVSGNSPDTPSQYTLKFWPPLRAAVRARASLNFDSPVCTMKFATDEAGELPIRHQAASTPSIDLVETF